VRRLGQLGRERRTVPPAIALQGFGHGLGVRVRSGLVPEPQGDGHVLERGPLLGVLRFPPRRHDLAQRTVDPLLQVSVRDGLRVRNHFAQVGESFRDVQLPDGNELARIGRQALLGGVARCVRQGLSPRIHSDRRAG
jgi:hypothetical protein